QARVVQVLMYRCLDRVAVPSAGAGDIVLLTGLEEVAIGDTLADPNAPDALPRIAIDEPTVRMTFGVNTSPFTGREGKFSTTRQLRGPARVPDSDAWADRVSQHVLDAHGRHRSDGVDRHGIQAVPGGVSRAAQRPPSRLFRR